jgi:hypothetical protein
MTIKISNATQPKMGACAELCSVLIQRVSPGTGANTTAHSRIAIVSSAIQ